MGLGKTVEVLALLMAHRAPLSHSNGHTASSSSSPPLSPLTHYFPQLAGGGGGEGEEEEEEVVQCVCGATSETGESGSEYVQCERCEIWLHSHCVSFDSSRHSSFICIKCLLEEVFVIAGGGDFLGVLHEKIAMHLQQKKYLF